MSKKILLINDLPSYGKVALSAMMPILSFYGYEVYGVPSALVSNTLDYGKFIIENMTAYLEKCIKLYRELGITFDCLCTGFIVDPQQVSIIKEIKKSNPQMMLIVDPIMADDGRLYNGMNEQTIKMFQQLCELADFIIPNYTESLLLSELPMNMICTKKQLKTIYEKLKKQNVRSMVITSCVLENGQHGVYGYDHFKDEFFFLPYDHINIRFAGTGDIFSAVLTNGIMKGEALKEAVLKAIKAVNSLIDINMVHDKTIPENHFKTLKIEPFLKDII